MFDRFIVAVFLMDYHSGQWSRGYRILSKMRPENFSASFCEDMRNTEYYAHLVANYENEV